MNLTNFITWMRCRCRPFPDGWAGIDLQRICIGDVTKMHIGFQGFPALNFTISYLKRQSWFTCCPCQACFSEIVPLVSTTWYLNIYIYINNNTLWYKCNILWYNMIYIYVYMYVHINFDIYNILLCIMVRIYIYMYNKWCIDFMLSTFAPPFGFPSKEWRSL